MKERFTPPVRYEGSTVSAEQLQLYAVTKEPFIHRTSGNDSLQLLRADISHIVVNVHA